MQPIVFKKSPMTLAEYESFNKSFIGGFFSSVLSPGFIALLALVFIVCTFLFFGDSATPFDLFSTLRLLAILALVIGVPFSIIKSLITSGGKEAYNANPDLAEGFTYTLTEEYITIEGKSTNRKQLDLILFEQSNLIDKWLVLSSHSGRYYLDFEKLVPPATVTEVGELLQRNGVTIA